MSFFLLDTKLKSTMYIDYLQNLNSLLGRILSRSVSWKGGKGTYYTYYRGICKAVGERARDHRSLLRPLMNREGD